MFLWRTPHHPQSWLVYGIACTTKKKTWNSPWFSGCSPPTSQCWAAGAWVPRRGLWSGEKWGCAREKDWESLRQAEILRVLCWLFRTEWRLNKTIQKGSEAKMIWLQNQAKNHQMGQQKKSWQDKHILAEGFNQWMSEILMGYPWSHKHAAQPAIRWPWVTQFWKWLVRSKTTKDIRTLLLGANMRQHHSSVWITSRSIMDIVKLKCPAVNEISNMSG